MQVLTENCYEESNARIVFLIRARTTAPRHITESLEGRPLKGFFLSGAFLRRAPFLHALQFSVRENARAVLLSTKGIAYGTLQHFFGILRCSIYRIPMQNSLFRQTRPVVSHVTSPKGDVEQTPAAEGDYSDSSGIFTTAALSCGSPFEELNAERFTLSPRFCGCDLGDCLYPAIGRFAPRRQVQYVA